MSSITDQHIVFAGEAILLNWGDTSSRGRTVTLKLPEDADTHPFRDFAITEGKKAGQRFQVVFVQVGDDELPVEQQRRLSQQAAILCKDAGFRAFIAERSISQVDTEEDAKQWMCSGAGISSRKEFDTNKRAADWFMTQCKLPYEAHRRMIDNGII